MYKSYVGRRTETDPAFGQKNDQSAASLRAKSSARFPASGDGSGPAASFSDVQIHYSPMCPVQFKPASGEVVQLARHLSNVQPITTTDIPVVPSQKPTMIFESMGISDDVMNHVYDETKKYKGNTVCVFGLNKEVGSGPGLHKADDRLQKPHNLVNFTFEWTKPHGMDASKGYRMPFVEARSEIMAQANRIVLEPCEPNSDEERGNVIPPGSPDPDMSTNPVYRWIDGDAADDSSEDININFLRGFADFGQRAEVVTGTYSWRHASDDTAVGLPNYHAFITLLNKKESLLRKTYFNCIRSEMSKLQKDGPYSTGVFYMPESTFMMNWAAHNAISRESNIASNAQQAASHNKINPDGDQAKESMRLYTASGIGVEGIIFRNDLHITKPLKDEFSNDGYAGSLMKFFKENGSYNRAKLEEALSGLRQSAFGSSWLPKGDAQGYIDAKNRCINQIEQFLTQDNKFVLIKRELG